MLTLTKAVQPLSFCDSKGLIHFLISPDSFLREGDPVNPGEGVVYGTTWMIQLLSTAQRILLLLWFSHTHHQGGSGGHASPVSSHLWLFSPFLKIYSPWGKPAYIPSQERETSLKHYWTFQISFIVSIVVTDDEGSQKRAESNCSLWALDLLVQADLRSTTVMSAAQGAAEREKHFSCWWRMNVTSSKDRRRP